MLRLLLLLRWPLVSQIMAAAAAGEAHRNETAAAAADTLAWPCTMGTNLLLLACVCSLWPELNLQEPPPTHTHTQVSFFAPPSHTHTLLCTPSRSLRMDSNNNNNNNSVRIYPQRRRRRHDDQNLSSSSASAAAAKTRNENAHTFDR